MNLTRAIFIRVIRALVGLAIAFVFGWAPLSLVFISFQGLGKMTGAFAAGLCSGFTVVWMAAGGVCALIAWPGLRNGLWTIAAFGAGGFCSAWIWVTALSHSGGGFWRWNNDAWRWLAWIAPVAFGAAVLAIGIVREALQQDTGLTRLQL